MSKKIFLSILAVLFVFIFVLGMFLLIPTSGYKYSDKVYSPSGEYYIQVSESNGGATTAYSSNVSIVNAKSQFNNYGILSKWMNLRSAVFALNGTLSSVNTSWIDNHTVKIIYTNCQQIYGQDNSWKDIKIVYEEKCSNNNVPSASASPTN